MRRQHEDRASPTATPQVVTLDSSFGVAQQHADLLRQPPEPWTARGSKHRATKHGRNVACAVLAAVIAAACYGWVTSKHTDGLGEAAAVDEMLTRAPPGAGVQPAPPWETKIRPVVTVQPAPIRPPKAVFAIQKAGVFQIEFNDAMLGEAVAALAKASNTTVHGGDALPLFEAVALQLHGASIEAAWEQLLDRFANTAMRCAASACDLWVVGLKPRASLATATSGANPPGALASVSSARGAASSQGVPAMSATAISATAAARGISTVPMPAAGLAPTQRPEINLMPDTETPVEPRQPD